MPVGWRPREAWLCQALAEIEGAGGVFACRLDRDGRRAADVLPLAGVVDYCRVFVSFNTSVVGALESRRSQTGRGRATGPAPGIHTAGVVEAHPGRVPRLRLARFAEATTAPRQAPARRPERASAEARFRRPFSRKAGASWHDYSPCPM